jgi:hypothetical protein
MLRELTVIVRRFLGVENFFGDMDARRLRFRCTPIKANKPEQEDDPLNSFLLPDLADVADSLHQGVKSKALDQYLSRFNGKDRLHVDNGNASLQLIDRLTPTHYASGCWPSERHLGLVHSQQLAVNTILHTLSNGEGILGVNGPPGTGKTTLLRDLIAAIVTSRADVLAELPRASDAFVTDGLEKANDGGKPQNSFKLNPALYGFEIVVASSNNGAVENVTLELPQKDKVDESWLPDADYFGDLGELVSGAPAWALISAALGSKSRRNTFVKRYFYGEPPPKPAAGAQPHEPTDDEIDDNELADLEDIDPPDEVDAADPDNDVPPAEKQEPRGFWGWLNTQAEFPRTTAQRQQTWQQAVSNYRTAKRKADRLSADAARIRDRIDAVIKARRTVAVKSEQLQALDRKTADVSVQLTRLDATEWKPAREELQKCLQDVQTHQDARPGFWANLFSLWAAWRTWNASHALLKRRHEVADADFERVKRLALRLQAEHTALQKLSAEGTSELRHLQEQAQLQIAQAISLAAACQAQHLLDWLKAGTLVRSDTIELAEPWIIQGWRQARANVFIQALALHRTFFELEAKRIRSNLFFINGMLTGSRFRGVSRDAIRSAWASLFMVVPVLSSTFASFARSFGSLGVGDIGWLLVDEAGQAPPQAAIGALWRARRAVLVGDPLQLKPIVTVSDATLEHMRTRYGVDDHWLPTRQSAQTLADQATGWGQMMGPDGDKQWVGLPLVVHRRCDRPMYTLANRIAYDGIMVYGTIAPHPDKETKASLPTGWIHASGPSTGNWVPAEGDALRQLLVALRADGVANADIAVITPFQAVRRQLKALLPKKMVHGTIHTMQGKEAAVIILVLGGDTSSPGARDWAVSEPNLLNVAATRAKRRFYVIGDRNDWSRRSLFCDVMDLLPRQHLPQTAPRPSSI